MLDTIHYSLFTIHYSLFMKPLPIGIQTFRKIVDGNYLYIDKTKQIYELIKDKTGVYFLSRPRRFGKSLLISILDEIFQGNKELFQGFWLYDSDYNWEKHPIIKMDWSKQQALEPEELIEYSIIQIKKIADYYNITLTEQTYYNQFEELIHKLHNSLGKVVILVDEYDKPIIDHLENPKMAAKMRDVLRGFYAILKGNDAYIRFLFLTGVSKFSKAGVFSSLNHLDDITFSNKFSTLVGITEEELKSYFQDYILEFSKEINFSKEKLLDKIRYWYNGYKFSPNGISVYNPFSTLLLFNHKKFFAHWFETGTPLFLVKLIKEKNFEINTIPVNLQESLFSSYDIERLDILPLLVQTGYLTIKSYDEERLLYTLDYPNFEVKDGFTTHLLKEYAKKPLSYSLVYLMIDSLKAKDFEAFFETLRGIFAGIEYDLHLPYEKYYQTIFYLIFTRVGLKISTEVKTNLGRIDAAILEDCVYIFEFKIVSEEEAKKKRIRKDKYAKEALNQIKTKKYYEKFNLAPSLTGKKIYLFGVEFKNKNIGSWVVEELAIND